jgi:hypothetical protein
MKSRIVEVNHDKYGKTKLDVAHVIALIPDKFGVVFELVIWYLDEDDYKRVDDAWTSYVENIICDVP